MITQLHPVHANAKSFNGKALVITENSVIKLQSYNTVVAEIKGHEATVNGDYSATTLKHIREFLLQNGFKAENKKQILKDYMKYYRIDLKL